MAFSSQLIGDLKSMSIPDIYQWVASNQRSGYVFFQRGIHEVKVFFLKGDIINVSSNIPDFLLGSILIRFKKLDKKTLANILKLQIKNKIPFGQLLVQSGAITEDDLIFALKQQTIELTTYLLDWDQGFFYFEEGEQKYKYYVKIKVEEVLFESIRRHDELELYRKVLKESDVIKISDNSNISEQYKDVIDGKKTVHEIIYTVGGDYIDVYKQLYDLFMNKKIEKIGTKSDPYDPSIKFLIALELFGKGRVYDSYILIKDLYQKYGKGVAIKNFYKNLVIFTDNAFEKKLGGEKACFKVNNIKLLDQKIYLTPKDGYVVSRLGEHPCFDDLRKVCNIEKIELKLILLKLYKMGVVLLKEIKKKETKELPEDTILALLEIIKNEMSGSLETITDEMKAILYFKSGKFVMGYSVSDKYSVISYIEKFLSKSFNIDDFEYLLNKLISDNIFEIDELEKSLEMYCNMLVREIIKSKAISNIFAFNDFFGYEITIDINLLYLIAFTLTTVDKELNLDFDLGQYYELTTDSEKILELFDNYVVIKNLIDKFNENMIDPASLRNLSTFEINILKILFYLEYLKPTGRYLLKVEELKNLLHDLQNKNPFEIFGVNKDNYNIDGVKKKYVEMSKKYHPDLFEDKERKTIAEEIFRTLKEAFDYLVKHEQEEESKLKIDAKKIFLAEQLLTSGKVYLNMGRISDACEAFIKAYENFNMDEEIKAYYGLALIKRGDFANGFEILDNTKFYNFNDPNLYYAYLDAAIRIKKIEKAKQALKKFESEFKSLSHKVDFYKRKLGVN